MTPAGTVRGVTLKDVALRAGVSTAATSQALNDRGNLKPETRDRIKAIAAELGYRPNKHAAALRSGRTMSVGFVMADAPAEDGRRALHRTMQLTSLVRASAAHGFTVTVLPDSRPDLLPGAQIDVLYFPDPADDRAILREAAGRGIPVVANDLYIAGAPGLSIRTGYDAAVRAGLAHLASAGAERIGLLVDESEVPRDQIGESAYLAWTTVRGRTPLVARVDASRRHLGRRVHDLLDAPAPTRSSRSARRGRRSSCTWRRRRSSSRATCSSWRCARPTATPTRGSGSRASACTPSRPRRSCSMRSGASPSPTVRRSSTCRGS